MPAPTVRIRRAFIEEIIAHARRSYPEEACGLLAGPPGEFAALYHCANAAEAGERHRRYSVDPAELLERFRQIDERGWELTGIWHSHPVGRARPSRTDVEIAYYPEAVYFIACLGYQRPRVRAFHIVEGKITELKIITLPQEPPRAPARLASWSYPRLLPAGRLR